MEGKLINASANYTDALCTTVATSFSATTTTKWDVSKARMRPKHLERECEEVKMQQDEADEIEADDERKKHYPVDFAELKNSLMILIK